MSLSGFSGFSGFSGHSGFSGFSGYSGGRGISGYSGYSGFSGLMPVSRIFAQTGSAFDFTNYDRINTEISTTSVMTVTGISAGETKTVLIKNTHATTQYGVTLPTHIGHQSPLYIPAGMQVRVTIIHNGTDLEITYTGAF